MTQLEQQLERLGIRPLEDRYLPLSKNELVTLEQALGERLPRAYRTFIQKYGRAAFDRDSQIWVESKVDSSWLRRTIDVFYGNRRSPEDTWDPTSLQAAIETYRGRMPDSLIPVGEDLTGNLFCLGISGPDRGKMFLWECDFEVGEEEDQAAKYENVSLLASSFVKFLVRLEIVEPGNDTVEITTAETPSRGEEDAAARLHQLRATLRKDKEGHVTQALFSGLRKRVTDAHLVHLVPFEHLRLLHLSETAIGNEGLRHVGKLQSLQILFLTDCKRVGDEGLSYLASLRRIIQLDLSGTSITDLGLRHIAGMRELVELYLKSTKVSDKGLSHLENMTTLRELSLIKTKITDGGLAHLRKLSNLERLELVSTAVTDGAVDLLKCFTNLKYLYVQATKITEEGAKTLQKALPDTNIWHPAL